MKADCLPRWSAHCPSTSPTPSSCTYFLSTLPFDYGDISVGIDRRFDEWALESVRDLYGPSLASGLRGAVGERELSSRLGRGRKAVEKMAVYR
jgi:hypothetical protein